MLAGWLLPVLETLDMDAGAVATVTVTGLRIVSLNDEKLPGFEPIDVKMPGFENSRHDDI